MTQVFSRADWLTVHSLMADDFLAAWLACPTTDILFWGTDNDPRNAPPLPVSVGTGWANSSGSGAGTWGAGTWGAGTWGGSAWVNGGGGGWGGGWGNEAAIRLRRIPRPRGYRRMGVIFLPPRVIGRRNKQRERVRRWLIGLERQWRCECRCEAFAWYTWQHCRSYHS
jgi:hypothetical protein